MVGSFLWASTSDFGSAGWKKIVAGLSSWKQRKTPGDVAILITPFNQRMGESNRLGMKMAAESSGLYRRFPRPSHFLYCGSVSGLRENLTIAVGSNV
jgi:hypothetical protein